MSRIQYVGSGLCVDDLDDFIRIIGFGTSIPECANMCNRLGNRCLGYDFSPYYSRCRIFLREYPPYSFEDTLRIGWVFEGVTVPNIRKFTDVAVADEGASQASCYSLREAHCNSFKQILFDDHQHFLLMSAV